MTSIGLITIHLLIPDCFSLKEKRSRVKPLLSRLHKEFNVSSAEVDLQDKWRETVIACTCVSSDRVASEKLLQQVVQYIEGYWPDLPVLDQKIELL